MQALLITLRLLHIVLGVFWAGSMIFVMIMLEPALRDLGPDGGRVMQALVKRGWLVIVPVSAILTILAGLGLMWVVSGGFKPEWFATPPARGFSIGALAAMAALGVGMRVTRPTAVKLQAAGAAAASAPPAEREARQAEVTMLRNRLTSSTRWVGTLLLIAVAFMAVSRYL
ncbi:MAG TPA: hypothetical protein VFK78_12820 [Gemmatimonadales bacterium]|nr:hypothetical protein [Gemmatimonadales bacterium]